MVYEPNFYNPYYEPVGYYYQPQPLIGNVPYQTPIKNVTYKINEYFFKALFYIKKIFDVLLQTSPIFEQYGPIIQELPKMYQLMKAISEASLEEDVNVQTLDYRHDGPPPRLFI